ncbi:MAG: hypothetical protein ABSA13_11390 [Beijerinckiaceae bacterium]
MMNFTLVDAGGFTLSVLSYGLILLLPGMCLAFCFDALGFRQAPTSEKLLTGLVTGSALLPLLDSMATRFTSLDSALAFNLGLAALAILLAFKTHWRVAPSRAAIALTAVWFAIVMFEWIDFDTGSILYQPFTSFDTVKHAATVQAIHDTGTPPLDPFFLRPERVSYYYFFYTIAALSQRLCGGLADAKAATGGLTFWTGIGLFAAMRLVLERGGYLPQADSGRRSNLVLLILAASGLDVLPVLIIGLWKGKWVADPASWSEQITGWFESVIWVPHHTTALIAILFGFMAAADCFGANLRRSASAAILAAMAFASALGLSIWVTFAAVAGAAFWFALLVAERRWRAVVALAVIGLIALVLAAPQIHDLSVGRSGGIPVTLTVHSFRPADGLFGPGIMQNVARFICLPLNYFLGFGVLFAGAWLYWRDTRGQALPHNELARAITTCAFAGLVIGSFLRSIIFNNDLGWRVMLFPMTAGLMWTAAWLERFRPKPIPLAMKALLSAGYATSLYALIGLRAYYAFLPVLPHSVQVFGGNAGTQHALRLAYAWANTHLPPQAVLQHNPHEPSISTRATAFGLYSRNPVAVSDRFGSLFGADFDLVSGRLSELAPIFEDQLSAEDVKNRATKNHIDELVVSSDDPVWSQPSSWVWQAKPDYESSGVRLIPVAALPNQMAGRAP